MGQWRRENFYSLRRKQRPHLRDPISIRAIAVADEHRLRIEPQDVSSLGGPRLGDRAKSRHALRRAPCTVMRRFSHTVRFSRAHQNQAEICGQGSIMSISGIEREPVAGGQFDDFRPRGRQFANQHSMLRLGDFKIRRAVKSQITPPGDLLWPVPSRLTGRAHQDALQFPDHGVSVESEAGLGKRGQGALLRFNDLTKE
jgi:hypothetical protein